MPIPSIWKATPEQKDNLKGEDYESLNHQGGRGSARGGGA